MGQNRQSNSGLTITLTIVILTVVLIIFLQYQQSLFLHNSRISIGVFADRPFVFSYDKDKNLGYIIHFNPEVLVNVSGGYSWYKLGGINLLGKIEKKRNYILQKSFTELIGAPIDLVIYQKEAKVIESQTSDFLNYFYKLRAKPLFSSAYAVSTKSVFDRILMKKALRLRVDHLIILNAESDYVLRSGKKYYDPNKLDLSLKGFFYENRLSETKARIKLFTTADYFNNANKRIRRIIEGTGIKVFDTEIMQKKLPPDCLIITSSDLAATIKRLEKHFACKVRLDSQDRFIIKFYLGSKLAKAYK